MFKCACICLCNNFLHVCRLVHQDGSLADLTMLSASSVETTLTREEQEPQEEQGTEQKEKEQALVVVAMPDTNGFSGKTMIFSDHRQSSTDESYHCSGGTEPEPSTEQSSGAQYAFTSWLHPLLVEMQCCAQLLIRKWLASEQAKTAFIHFFSVSFFFF